MTPRIIASEFSDVVPLVIRGPGKVLGVDLGAAAEGGASRVVNVRAGDVSVLSMRDVGCMRRSRGCVLGRVKTRVVGPVASDVRILGVTAGLRLVLIVLDEELPRVAGCLCSPRGTRKAVSMEFNLGCWRLTATEGSRGGSWSCRHQLRSGRPNVLQAPNSPCIC